MKITLCGSIAFYSNMLELKIALEKIHHEVLLPPAQVSHPSGKAISTTEYYQIRQTVNDENSWVWSEKKRAMREHYHKIEQSDAVLVVNLAKTDVDGFIGGNTLVEMGIASYLNKQIYLLNQIPHVSYREEIVALNPIILNRDLSKIHQQLTKTS